ncbi:penicillin acylase family protein [Sphingomonas sp. 28-63-12]|uniref:penicillin acylase family protein n=1 Tax=Sphingomonas sp. 28-63-12 TaxID=1970434 RepID=UPI000BD4F3DF|nr:MAG: acyl-homoserine-lactone acylase [Sphingomonas sp. 28-63-12]
MMRKLALGALLLASVSSGAAMAKAPRFAATIVRTSYGIPHISAGNWSGIGYGVGYAYAQDNLCMLAEEFATVAGERSKYFGPKDSAVLGFDKIDNLASDVFFRSAIDLPRLRRGITTQGPEAQAVIRGYVAGYNRLLRDLGPEGVPIACRGKPWLHAITADDMLRLTEKQVLLASSLALAAAVVNAAPPGADHATSQAVTLPDQEKIGVGSNGWAFGGDLTTDGRGLLVGNPHFPWNGPARFWEMHLTIPGVYDVMGVGIAGTPIVSLGFNKDIGWTHTVTAAQHFTLFELAIDPADPTSYIVDGKSEKMLTKTISVPMPDGAAPVTRTLYSSRFGPMVAAPALLLSWSKTKAFSMRDANAGNQRGLAAWIAIGKAKNVGDIKTALATTLGIPWVNTIAVDRGGNALHADVTAVPNVSTEKAKACATPASALLAGRVVLLDGSKAACDWDNTPGTAAPRLLPAGDQAVWERRDYVANSNDSYWLSNPAAPYRQLSPILGPWGTMRTLRTRSGLTEIARRLAGTDGLPAGKLDHAHAEAMALANKSLAAELVTDRLVALCTGKPDLAAACDALAHWDRRFDLDSRGAYLFHTFWATAQSIQGLWAVKYDPADPVNTPRDLITEGAIGEKLLAALTAAAARLAAENIALDARWGDVQFTTRGSQRIAIHGAAGALGVLNVQQSQPVPGGITPMHGSSYMQVVGFDDKGPAVDAVLSYSQSTDPASPHFGDQTLLYSAKRWVRLPFTPAQIAADAQGQAVKISE